jgi:hypothetical protein
MEIKKEKPVYYDGSGALKLLEKDSDKEFISKPTTEVIFKGVPYFPFLNEKK